MKDTIWQSTTTNLQHYIKTNQTVNTVGLGMPIIPLKVTDNLIIITDNRRHTGVLQHPPTPWYHHLKQKIENHNAIHPGAFKRSRLLQR
jgi:hypothetical protein